MLIIRIIKHRDHYSSIRRDQFALKSVLPFTMLMESLILDICIVHLNYLMYRYSTTFADAICRWECMKGCSTFLTTGTDEHGQKVQKEADKQKIDVRSYCDRISSSFQKELSNYSLNIGRFIRTTDSDHEQVLLKKIDE